MNMKKLGALALSAVLALGVCACGAKPAEEANVENDGLTKITVCLDWTPNTNHTGLYVAQEKGYYEEAGLDVEIVQPPEDGCVPMCASGQAQFAINAQDTIAPAWDSEEPMAVTAVAGLIQHNTSGILSRAGEGLDSPKGLEGKVYSTWESPTELAMLRHVMEADGADFDQVTLIPNNITDEPAALAAKQTDAIWVFYAWGGINAQIEDVACDYWNFSDISPELDYYTPILIANNDFLAENPDVAKAFLAATAEGYQFAIENPDEAAEILIAGDNTGSLAGAEELVKASQKWLADQYIADAPGWGYIDQERWDGFYEWLYNNGLSFTRLTGSGYTNDYLPE